MSHNLYLCDVKTRSAEKSPKCFPPRSGILSRCASCSVLLDPQSVGERLKPTPCVEMSEGHEGLLSIGQGSRKASTARR